MDSNEKMKLIINGFLKTPLNAIEKTKNLEKLIITNYNLTDLDIEYIKSFDIKVLQLDNVSISNILSFGNSIERLYLCNIESNFSINLSGMINLTNFKIHQCENINILKLNNLPNLKEIHINNSYLSKIQGLENLTGLNTINLDGSKIENSFIFPSNPTLNISCQKEFYLTKPIS